MGAERLVDGHTLQTTRRVDLVLVLRRGVAEDLLNHGPLRPFLLRPVVANRLSGHTRLIPTDQPQRDVRLCLSSFLALSFYGPCRACPSRTLGQMLASRRGRVGAATGVTEGAGCPALDISLEWPVRADNLLAAHQPRQEATIQLTNSRDFCLMNNTKTINNKIDMHCNHSFEHFPQFGVLAGLG